MSRHYFGNQYDRPYGATLLRNWEVPKHYKGGYLVDKVRPTRSSTKIISNERGHLVPGVQRTKETPWIHFPTTWHLPKKIDRKTADEISGLNKIKKFVCSDGKPKEKHVQLDALATLPTEEPKEEEKIEKPVQTTEECENDINLPNVYDAKNSASDPVPYVPGDFTEDHHRHESYDELKSKRFNGRANTELHLIGKGYPRYREDFSRASPTLTRISQQEALNSSQGEDMPKTPYRPPEQRLAEMQEDDGLGIRDTITNFQLAKELHRQNLDHNPLPDKICHSHFQKMQMMREEVPGLALEEGDFATGVGWKGYQGYGPTRCTKLKVFRPKSSLLQPRRPGEKHDTWANFEQKWRFIKQSKVSPMDLALCWDLKPENPKDEPKRPVHIDGSNGCLAPAVFTLVHTPKENIGKKGTAHSCDGVRDCVPLFYSTNKLGDDKNYFFERRSARDFSEQLQQKIDDAKRSISAQELREIDKLKENNTIDKNIRKNVSIAKLNSVDKNEGKCNETHPCCAEYHKKSLFAPKRKYEGSCVTCQMNNISIGDKKNMKYTSKAGVSQKRVSKSLNLVRVPRPRKPYASKSYRIESLAPPFSLQKEKRDDYPEHWRLATVYQHSYKPIKNRKCTLLSTVFK